MTPVDIAPPALIEAVGIEAGGIDATGATGFAPRIDHPLRYRIEQQRDEAGATRRYVTDRSVTFRRTTDGIVADLTITAVDGGLSTGPGALFERAFATLRGRPIRYHLSPDGRVTEVEDRARLWASLIDAVVAQAGDSAPRIAIATRLADPLRHMADAQQVAMLGSMLATILAPDVVRGGVRPARAIRQPGTPPFGTGSIVTGNEQIRRVGAMLIEERRLEGDVVAPAGATGRRTVTRSRKVDAATGLVVSDVEVVRIETGGTISLSTTRVMALQP